MADRNSWEDFKGFANWAYNRATSHPLDRLDKTLVTRRVQSSGGRSLSQDLSPITQAYESAKTYIEGPAKRKPAKSKSRRYGPAAPKRFLRSKGKR